MIIYIIYIIFIYIYNLYIYYIYILYIYIICVCGRREVSIQRYLNIKIWDQLDGIEDRKIKRYSWTIVQENNP